VKLVYIANIRLPTEKAHGLQIMQNCEAFADAGADVSLWIARRLNTAAYRGIEPFAHYGVARGFTLRRLPCIDLLLWTGPDHPLAKAAFALQLVTFTLSVVIAALLTRADTFYSRDLLPLLLLSLFKPRQTLAYEAHSAAGGKLGAWLQSSVLRRVGHVFTTTARLRDDLIARGADAAHTSVAHDGVRRARFESQPSRADARTALGWDQSAYIVAYVGRLQTMGMDKGVMQLVEALANIGGASLALVGGPDEGAAALRARWHELGQDDVRFLYAGQVAPERVPLYLAACDVCAMPFPFTPHFAYYASPIKLFEYMAAGRAIVASDLPSTAEVVQDGETALLYPVGDGAALGAALARLRDDPALRERLGSAARRLVMKGYTWDARTAAILAKLEE
jgi:glycosyltransferase involved in cell wall biosynthesis